VNANIKNPIMASTAIIQYAPKMIAFVLGVAD